MSWNATGIMSSAGYLCETLMKYHIDFCGISEHWLMESNSNFLSTINSHYKCITVVDKSCRFPYNRHTGIGGVAILWHEKHDRYVSVIQTDDDRIAGVQISIAEGIYLFIFQVYLPCTNHSSEMYRYYIDQLLDLWSMYSALGTVIFTGDFNAKFVYSDQVRFKPRDRQFTQFLNDCNLVAIDTLPLCIGAKSTFVSYNKTSESLIDHICTPVEKQDCILKCEILDDHCLNVSTHRPIFCCINVQILKHHVVSIGAKSQTKKRVGMLSS